MRQAIPFTKLPITLRIRLKISSQSSMLT